MQANDTTDCHCAVTMRSASGESAFGDIVANFHVLTDAMPQMVWSTLPDGFHDYYNAQWYAFTGVPAGSTDGTGWNHMFHPDDRERAWARWRRSLQTGEPYEVEYRLRHHTGTYRWTLGRALPVRDASGRITRWIGTCTDIDAAKKESEQNEILSRELSHRIKNIFAVIGGLIGLSAREHPNAKDYAKQLKERVAALGRAHEFVRPHSEKSKPQVVQIGLHELLSELLSPYPALAEGRIEITGDNLVIDDRSTTPLTLAFHELATNSAKYGAIGSTGGTLVLHIAVTGAAVIIEWTEQVDAAICASAGGPPGFGSKLIDLSVQYQLSGMISKDWRDSGLKVRIEIPIENLQKAQAARRSSA